MQKNGRFTQLPDPLGLMDTRTERPSPANSLTRLIPQFLLAGPLVPKATTANRKNQKNPLVSLPPHLTGHVLSFLPLKDCARVSSTCFSLWNAPKSKPFMLHNRLRKLAQSDRAARYLLDFLELNPRENDHALNFAHAVLILRVARPILDTLVKTDPRSAWKIDAICGMEEAVEEDLPEEAIETVFDQFARGVMAYYALGDQRDCLAQFIADHHHPFDQKTADPHHKLAHAAALGGHVEGLQYLCKELRYDLLATEDPESLLTSAVMGGHLPTFEFLRSAGIQPQNGLLRFAFTAAEYGHWSLHDHFIGEGKLDLSADNATRIAQYAFKTGNLTKALSLIEEHALSPLLFKTEVITGGHPEIFWHFIKEKWLSPTEIFEGGITVAHLLAREGHLELLQAILPLDGTLPLDAQGQSLLHYAAAGGSWPVYLYLLDRYYKGRALLTDHEGNTVAHSAAKAGQAHFLKHLHSHDPTLLSEKNKQGKTILHEAAIPGDREMLRMIINEFQIDVMSEDSNGNSLIQHLTSLAIGERHYWNAVSFIADAYNIDLTHTRMGKDLNKAGLTIQDIIKEENAEAYFPEMELTSLGTHSSRDSMTL